MLDGIVPKTQTAATKSPAGIVIREIMRSSIPGPDDKPYARHGKPAARHDGMLEKTGTIRSGAAMTTDHDN
jgi:hypothetical protein